MELADVQDSKSCGSNTVSVRPRPPAPKKSVIPYQDYRFFIFSYRSIIPTVSYIIVNIRRLNIKLPYLNGILSVRPYLCKFNLLIHDRANRRNPFILFIIARRMKFMLRQSQRSIFILTQCMIRFKLYM